MTDIEEALAAFAEDPTLVAAQNLEVALDEAYPNDPLIQECVASLASYRPGGGHLLFDKVKIRPLMNRLGRHLGIASAGP